jgi:hypothetical protein
MQSLALGLGLARFSFRLRRDAGRSRCQFALTDVMRALLRNLYSRPVPVGAVMRYRLLDTRRAYMLATSIEDTELADVAVRHAGDNSPEGNR